jgi:L-lactate dehydrogenase complex protein LldG
VSSRPRDTILAGIRAALRRPTDPEDISTDAVDDRLRTRAAQVVPAIARGARSELVNRFIANAETAGATMTRTAPDGMADAVVKVLGGSAQSGRVAVAADPRLDPLETSNRLTVERRGTPSGDDTIAVGHAMAGLAETGTLLMASGPDSPSTLNVLPDTHVIVVRTSDIVGGLEDGWDRLRQSCPDGMLPRTVHLITGPSRTGDIEQTIQIGAHGPRQLHVILVDDDADAGGI